MAKAAKLHRVDGSDLTVPQIAAKYKLDRTSIYGRMRRGATAQEAVDDMLTGDPNAAEAESVVQAKRHVSKQKIKYEGTKDTVAGHCKTHKVSPRVVRKRMDDGATFAEAMKAGKKWRDSGMQKRLRRGPKGPRPATPLMRLKYPVSGADPACSPAFWIHHENGTLQKLTVERHGIRVSEPGDTTSNKPGVLISAEYLEKLGRATAILLGDSSG